MAAISSLTVDWRGCYLELSFGFEVLARTYLLGLCDFGVHLLLILKNVQGLVPFCVAAVGKAFNCTYFDPLRVQ